VENWIRGQENKEKEKRYREKQKINALDTM